MVTPRFLPRKTKQQSFDLLWFCIYYGAFAAFRSILVTLLWLINIVIPAILGNCREQGPVILSQETMSTCVCRLLDILFTLQYGAKKKEAQLVCNASRTQDSVSYKEAKLFRSVTIPIAAIFLPERTLLAWDLHKETPNMESKRGHHFQGL